MLKHQMEFESMWPRTKLWAAPGSGEDIPRDVSQTARRERGHFGVPADKALGPWWRSQHWGLPRHPPVTTPMLPRWTGSPGPRSSALVMAGARGSRGAGWQRVCRSAAGTRRSLPGAGCPSRRLLSRGSTGLPPTCPEKDKTVRGQKAFQTDHGIVALLWGGRRQTQLCSWVWRQFQTIRAVWVEWFSGLLSTETLLTPLPMSDCYCPYVSILLS